MQWKFRGGAGRGAGEVQEVGDLVKLRVSQCKLRLGSSLGDRRPWRRQRGDCLGGGGLGGGGGEVGGLVGESEEEIQLQVRAAPVRLPQCSEVGGSQLVAAEP